MGWSGVLCDHTHKKMRRKQISSPFISVRSTYECSVKIVYKVRWKLDLSSSYPVGLVFFLASIVGMFLLMVPNIVSCTFSFPMSVMYSNSLAESEAILLFEDLQFIVNFYLSENVRLSKLSWSSPLMESSFLHKLMCRRISLVLTARWPRPYLHGVLPTAQGLF